MSIINAVGITKVFYDPVPTPIFSNLTLEIEACTFNAITGKSGCGKSTLLYILSTLDTNFSGELYINNVSLKGKTDSFLSKFRNESIGFVFQSQFLLNELNVIKNISLPLYKKCTTSWKEADEKSYELLRKFKLEEHSNKRISQLSGGQQQRIAIARSLICDPQIIFADEPTGNLDIYNSNVVFDLFRQITLEMKKTIIVVTHDNEFAIKCDRIINIADTLKQTNT